MSSTIKVRKHDKYRALNSDVLPYETPMIFSNHGLYFGVKNKICQNEIISNTIKSDKVGSSSPYILKVTKPNGDYREIHIPHPAHQIAISEFLYKNSEIILSLCSISNYSIRYPSGITSYFKEFNGNSISNFINKDMDVNSNNELDNESGFAHSFFTYKSYTLLYKYFKSLEYLSLEKRFKFHGKFDLLKCFPSIYTHSLAWAIKGKEFSKNNQSANSFENEFDKLMMQVNDGESHGIIVGPEFSRIFAEIILQRIDVNVEKRLDSLGIMHKSNYRIHRYVDDYFIYSNNESTIELIKKLFSEELLKYKLFQNESKDHLSKRPFITNLGIAKLQVEEKIETFFKTIKTEISTKGITLDLIRNPYQASQSLINSVRLIIKMNNVSFEAFSGLVFSIFREKLSLYFKEIAELKNSTSEKIFLKNEVRYTNLIIFCLDFVFYIYSQNIRVRTSFLMSQILVIIYDTHELVSDIGKRKIEKKIRDESRVFFSILDSENKPQIETLNFIISLNHLFINKIKLQTSIERYFNKNTQFDYFTSISTLYVLSKNGENSDSIRRVIDCFKSFLVKHNSPSKNTEIVLFILDIIKYPHVSIDIKKELLNLYLSKTEDQLLNTSLLDKVYKQIDTNKYWFVDWTSELKLKELLVKKESQSSYN